MNPDPPAPSRYTELEQAAIVDLVRLGVLADPNEIVTVTRSDLASALAEWGRRFIDRETSISPEDLIGGGRADAEAGRDVLCEILAEFRS